MNREEFLQGLQTALSGNIPPAAVHENLQYYQDYIQTEEREGRPEAEIMEELGDPRLIARTIIDTTPEAEEGSFEEYRGGYGNYGDYTGGYADSSAQKYGGEERGGSGTPGGNRGIHYYDLNKWYWKLLGIALVIGIMTMIITVVTGLLSLVIPLLPIIGLVILVMWIVRGPGR